MALPPYIQQVLKNFSEGCLLAQHISIVIQKVFTDGEKSGRAFGIFNSPGAQHICGAI